MWKGEIYKWVLICFYHSSSSPYNLLSADFEMSCCTGDWNWELSGAMAACLGASKLPLCASLSSDCRPNSLPISQQASAVSFAIKGTPLQNGRDRMRGIALNWRRGGREEELYGDYDQVDYAQVNNHLLMSYNLIRVYVLRSWPSFRCIMWLSNSHSTFSLMLGDMVF